MYFYLIGFLNAPNLQSFSKLSRPILTPLTEAEFMCGVKLAESALKEQKILHPMKSVVLQNNPTETVWTIFMSAWLMSH